MNKENKFRKIIALLKKVAIPNSSSNAQIDFSNKKKKRKHQPSWMYRNE